MIDLLNQLIKKFMKEIINLNIGQAGINMGDEFWNMMAKEHKIDEEGFLTGDGNQGNPHCIFSETQKGNFVSRGAFFDTDYEKTDEMKKKSKKGIHCLANIKGGKQDAASNYCRGHFTIGRDNIGQCENIVRKMAEKCQSLDVIMINHSIGGGTGSGFASLISNRLSIQYPKKIKADFHVFPSKSLYNSVVEPYNAMVAAQEILEYSTISFPFSNQRLYQICSQQQQIENPSYTQINKIIAQTASDLTCTHRFPSENHNSFLMNDLATNLIPYPRLNAIVPSYAPFPAMDSQYHSKIDEITKSVFEKRNCMMEINQRTGKYLSCALVYRGMDMPTNEISKSIRRNRDIALVDWSPTGIKIGVNKNAPSKLPTVSLLANTSSLKQSYERLSLDYDKLYAKRAFVHWFAGEGAEGDLREARDSISYLIKDYEEGEMDTVVDDQQY